MIRRPPRSTRVRSSAASDVYKRQLQETVVLERRTLECLDRLQPRCSTLYQMALDPGPAIFLHEGANEIQLGRSVHIQRLFLPPHNARYPPTVALENTPRTLISLQLQKLRSQGAVRQHRRADSPPPASGPPLRLFLQSLRISLFPLLRQTHCGGPGPAPGRRPDGIKRLHSDQRLVTEQDQYRTRASGRRNSDP